MQPRPIGLAVVVALVATFAAGCGGGSGRLSKAEYEARIQADGRNVQTAVQQISSSLGSLAQLAKHVAAAEVAARAAADDLAAAKPPEEVAVDNDKLVAALRTIVVQLQKLEQAAKAGDQFAAQQAATAIQGAPEVKAGQAAVKDMKQKGYKVGAIGD